MTCLSIDFVPYSFVAHLSHRVMDLRWAAPPNGPRARAGALQPRKLLMPAGHSPSDSTAMSSAAAATSVLSTALQLASTQPLPMQASEPTQLGQPTLPTLIFPFDRYNMLCRFVTQPKFAPDAVLASAGQRTERYLEEQTIPSKHPALRATKDFMCEHRGKMVQQLETLFTSLSLPQFVEPTRAAIIALEREVRAKGWDNVTMAEKDFMRMCWTLNTLELNAFVRMYAAYMWVYFRDAFMILYREEKSKGGMLLRNQTELYPMYRTPSKLVLLALCAQPYVAYAVLDCWFAFSFEWRDDAERGTADDAEQWQFVMDQFSATQRMLLLQHQRKQPSSFKSLDEAIAEKQQNMSAQKSFIYSQMVKNLRSRLEEAETVPLFVRNSSELMAASWAAEHAAAPIKSIVDENNSKYAVAWTAAQGQDKRKRQMKARSAKQSKNSQPLSASSPAHPEVSAEMAALITQMASIDTGATATSDTTGLEDDRRLAAEQIRKQQQQQTTTKKKDTSQLLW
jgi:hypothetical protein